MAVQIQWFEQLGMGEVEQVGGKNASLGEMISNLSALGVKVPNGYATTADAFRDFISQAGLADKINAILSDLNTDDVKQLANTGQQIRDWIMQTPFLPAFEDAVREAYQTLEAQHPDASFAVRSSATAEDLPDASFAGQQETLLNVKGIDAIFDAIKLVFASLYNDRAIAYRVHQGFSHSDVALSAGIQRMVRSDLASSGVMFTIDTESGFEDVVFITSSYGLGETVVQGAVNPDEFYVHKPSLAAERPAIVRRHVGSKAIKMIYAPADEDALIQTVEVEPAAQKQFSLTDDEITYLAKQAVIIEQHYQRPMDIEWGKDGSDGQLYILQARPETVQSRADKQIMERYQLNEKGTLLVTGRAIGQRIGSGKARIIKNLNELDKVEAGDILISDMTDPDWEPVMKKASAIVTNRGGRTCHAAIIARELGIPAVVGCGDATKKIQDGVSITVSCAEGDDGFVYDGLLDFKLDKIEVGNMPTLPVKVMMNIANPERAFAFQSLPNAGVGLARLEFIISNSIGIHPKALLNFDTLRGELRDSIADKIAAYESPSEFYIEKLRESISTLACAFRDKPVIVRLSDFKSNEYANLLGGHLYEPEEENPMIGFRGAARYIDDSFSDCFALECEAVKRVRNDMGLTNVEIMIPFVRTLSEAKAVIDVLDQHGLKRGDNGLRVIMMCELPSNALLAEEFLAFFDGFSIGSNDLTQLTLGLDRDSGLIADKFDERDPAVMKLLAMAINQCKKNNKYIGICGQGPSDHPDLAEWLMKQGIESLSLNPDSVVKTILQLAKA